MDLYFRFYEDPHWNDLQMKFNSISDVRNFIDRMNPDLRMMHIGDELLVLRDDMPSASLEPFVEVFLLSEEPPEDDNELE